MSEETSYAPCLCVNGHTSGHFVSEEVLSAGEKDPSKFPLCPTCNSILFPTTNGNTYNVLIAIIVKLNRVEKELNDLKKNAPHKDKKGD